MGRAKLVKVLLVVLTLVSWRGSLINQDRAPVVIEKEHARFYGPEAEIDFNAILELSTQKIHKIQSITLHYNMAISSLGAQWLANGKVVEEIELPRGIGRSVTCALDSPFPVRISLKLTGARGQIQVTSVEARVIVGAEPNSQTPISRLTERKSGAPEQAKYFAIVAPIAGEIWEIGQTATVYWRSSGISGQLALELFRDSDKIALLSRNVPVAAGLFRWRLPANDLLPGGGYQVRLTSLTDNKSYVSESFSIAEEYRPSALRNYSKALRTLEMKPAASAKPVSLKVLSPRYRDQWNVLREYVIQWESTGLTREDDIVIALKPISGERAKIIGLTKNTGAYAFRVPYPLIFMSFDIQVIVAPLKARSVEALSEPFAILRPAVDLIANDPSVSYRAPERRKRKWWEFLGDLFTFGMIWHVSEAIEVAYLMIEGTTMEVDLNVINKGLQTLKGVTVDCSIQTTWGNVLYAFPPRTIPDVYPDVLIPVAFSARTRQMKLEKGTYVLEVLIDPENRTGEPAAFRENNRVTVEFEVK